MSFSTVFDPELKSALVGKFQELERGQVLIYLSKKPAPEKPAVFLENVIQIFLYKQKIFFEARKRLDGEEDYTDSGYVSLNEVWDLVGREEFIDVVYGGSLCDDLLFNSWLFETYSHRPKRILSGPTVPIIISSVSSKPL